ncbi:MAG TPA: Trk system potassium transport protein TrkA, partial [Pseudohongiella sp.]|nr:Trk system potassium transport protein TrkA [Pseudohongiella sp.]
MKIIILGCNAVSASLAENLASENTDITLVDPDAEALRELKDRLDIGIAQGWPSHPDVLRAAGADDADMIIAVTENDEINMVACQIAFSVYKTPKKICRLRSASYIAQDDLFRPDAIPLDVVIS